MKQGLLQFKDIKKLYSIIYADPPWTYRDKALAGNRGAGCKYEVQSDQWVYDLPVKDICSKDCTLFLWATFPKIQEALNTVGKWGFEYKTVAFTWVKENKVADSLFWGMGGWTRSNSEVCLLGTRGKPKRLDAGVHSVIKSKVQAHSKKPAEARDKIIKLMGELPRIELFARERVEGWSSWGNEL